ncbi:hypothetical protein VM1G_08661 [Cytospora mali]|uniref:J domain-containing protein n=1 Tax=Cytospora mali TaxID=578113 RepID=A0A194W943_CYTMA|nr:hypothetical protein VM1G_08661 [Valsa mali]
MTTFLLRTSTIPITGNLPHGVSPSPALSCAYYGCVPPGRKPPTTTPWTLQQTRFASNNKKWYTILGVSPQASSAEVKKAYYREAKRQHPDVSGRNTAAIYIELKAAYDTGFAAAKAAEEQAAISHRAAEAQRMADLKASMKAREKQEKQEKQEKDREARKAAEAERKRVLDARRAAERKRAAEKEKAARATKTADAKKAAKARRSAEAVKIAEKKREAAAFKAAAEARMKLRTARLVILRGMPRAAELSDLFDFLTVLKPGPVLDARLEDGAAMVEFYTAEAADRFFLFVTEVGLCYIRGRHITVAAKYPGRQTLPAEDKFTSRILGIQVGLTAMKQHESMSPIRWIMRVFKKQRFVPDFARLYSSSNQMKMQIHFASLTDARRAEELLARSCQDVKVEYVADPAEEDVWNMVRRALWLGRELVRRRLWSWLR